MTTATVTDVFKRTIIDTLYADYLDSASKYYIGIGRAQPWSGDDDSDKNPTVPVPSKHEANHFMDNMQSVKLVEDVSKVVRRYNYTTGNLYSAWNDDNHSLLSHNAGEVGNDPCLGDYGYKPPYYAITVTNGVYLCIKQGIGSNGLALPSTTQPIELDNNVVETPDNYQWKLLQTVGVSATRKFLTSGYIPAQRILDSEDGGLSYDDLELQEQELTEFQRVAVPGEIIGVEIVSGGSGYTNTLNTADPLDWVELDIHAIPLVIDGVEQTVTPAKAWARVINGTIVDVTMKEPGTNNDPGNFYFGANYDKGTVITVGSVTGTGAELRALVSSPQGIGYDIGVDMNSTAIMFNVILEGAANNNSFITDNDFRQIGLIRNPIAQDSDGSGEVATYRPLTELNSIAMPKLTINIFDPNYLPQNITGDNIIYQSTTGASGILNSVQEDEVYYTQNWETGYIPFESGSTIDIGNGGGSTTVMKVGPSPVWKSAGAVYYVDNREPFFRNAEQTEDIKIVLDF